MEEKGEIAMPTIYLSPSTQEGNPYVTGAGSEEYFMNLLADAMVPYLDACGIDYGRNTPDMTALSSVRQANSGNYDFYLALHSNATGNGEPRPIRGVIAFYYPGSTQGQRAAEIFAKNLKNIYPLPDLVTTRATTTLVEVSRSRAPAVLLEIGYHDNFSDAVWIENNIDAIAQNLVRSLAEYFGIPFIYPIGPLQGRVRTEGGALLLRSYPARDAAIITRMPNGAFVTVYGQWQGWYVTHYEGYIGYAAAAYIAL